VRAGVSANGKGVKVGGVPKEKDGGRTIRKKGKNNVDIVSVYCPLSNVALRLGEECTTCLM